MKNKPFFSGLLIAVLTIIFVAAGCASAGTGGAVEEDPAAAEQLVADINAIEAGKAVVKGATVTLTGEVRLTTGLTVSAGVTLDLTKEALNLGDNAVLTVNGAVNATGHGDHGGDWVAGNLRIEDGATAINGSGTIRLADKGRLLQVWGGNDQKLTLDGVTLVGLSDNDQSLVSVGGGSTLVMKSGAITGNTRIGDEWASGGGVEVIEDGAFTMEGGRISGNSVNGKKNGNGGGVHVWKGTFVMEGGSISGNTAQGGENASGGGVNVGEGTFTMEGGVILGNSASAANWAGGGGVNASNDGSTFTMTGGEISGNTAQGGEWSVGGGVQVDENAVFTLKGGTIYGKSGNLPAGSDPSLANSAGVGVSSLHVNEGTVKWGTGGTYTKGGAAQTAGSDIGNSDDTLIATPAP
jgi:hypothetical protein